MIDPLIMMATPPEAAPRLKVEFMAFAFPAPPQLAEVTAGIVKSSATARKAPVLVLKSIVLIGVAVFLVLMVAVKKPVTQLAVTAPDGPVPVNLIFMWRVNFTSPDAGSMSPDVPLAPMMKSDFTPLTPVDPSPPNEEAFYANDASLARSPSIVPLSPISQVLFALL